MRVSTPTVLSLAGISALSFAVAGCGETKSRSAYLSQGTGAITSDQVLAAAANGAIPGVPGLSDLAQGALNEGPGVQITSPTRATFMPLGNVNVEAKITDKGRGIAEVKINGMTANLAADGTVSANIALQPGLNTVVVEAVDATQKRTEKHLSVLAGDFAPETTALARTGSLRLTDDALDQLEPFITQQIEAKRAELTRQVLNTNMGKNTSATGFRFGQVRSEIDSVPGGINFVIDVADIALDFQVKIKILFVFRKTKKGTIRAQNLRITGKVNMALDANGQLTSQVTGVNAVVTGLTVPSFARDYRQKIEDAFTSGFTTQGSQQMTAAVGQLLATTPTNGQTATTVLGQTLRADWALTGLTFDDWGVTTVFGSNVRADNPTYGNMDKSWVVNTPVSDLVGAGPGWNGALAVHQNAINQTLHAAWRSGALTFTLDQNTYNQLVPGGTPLNSNTFGSLMPGLSNFIPSGPLRMEVESQLPPTVKVVTGMPHMLELSMAEVRVATFVDGSNGSMALGEAIYTVKAEVSLREIGGVVRMVPTGQIDILVDVYGQALPGTEQMLEAVADGIATPLMAAALANTGGLPIPTMNGAQFSNAQFMGHQDSVVAAGNVTLTPRTP